MLPGQSTDPDHRRTDHRHRSTGLTDTGVSTRRDRPTVRRAAPVSVPPCWVLGEHYGAVAGASNPAGGTDVTPPGTRLTCEDTLARLAAGCWAVGRRVPSLPVAELCYGERALAPPQ